MNSKKRKVIFFIFIQSLFALVCLSSQTNFQYNANGNQISISFQGSDFCNDEPTSSTEIAENELDVNKLLVHPNPFNQQLTVEVAIAIADNYSILLHNNLGEIIANPLQNKWLTKGKHLIPLPDITVRGILTIQLSSASRVITKKIISQ